MWFALVHGMSALIIGSKSLKIATFQPKRNSAMYFLILSRHFICSVSIALATLGGISRSLRYIFKTLIRLSNPSWEVDVLPNLAMEGNLAAFEHTGFWFAMDTLRDKEHLENLLESGSAPWLR